MDPLTKRPKWRAVIADPARESREVSAAILSNAGFETTQVGVGPEVLTAAAEHPDLVVLETAFPDADGLDLCRRLRSNPRTAIASVIFYSRDCEDTGVRVRALEAGGDVCLIAPARPEELAATARSLMRAREAEAGLTAWVHRWHTTIDSLEEGVALLGGNGWIVQANRALAQLAALPQAELPGRSLPGLFPGQAGALQEMLERSLSSRECESGELAVNGRWLRFGFTTPRQDWDPAAGCTVTVADITRERLQAQRNEVLAAALSRSIDGIAVTDSDGLIIYANTAMGRLHEIAPGQPLGKPFWTLFDRPHQEPAFVEQLLRTLREGDPWCGRLTVRRGDGTSARLDCGVSPIANPDGHLTHFVILEHDLTADPPRRGFDPESTGVASPSQET